MEHCTCTVQYTTVTFVQYNWHRICIVTANEGPERIQYKRLGPRNETAIFKTELKCSVSKFLHSYICERNIYFQDQTVYSAAEKICGPILEIYISLTDT